MCVTDPQPGSPSKATAAVGWPLLYASLVIAALAATFVYQLRANGIFACSAAGYSAGNYLAYCNSLAFGDYDHGALWFDFEPEVKRRAAEAEVLFLGSSRLQFAFSSPPTEEWFAKEGLSYYLLGFAYTENITFTGPLLAEIRPRAKAYVINSDHFFDDRETAPVAEIFHGDSVESRYRRKRLWQYPHRVLCTAVPALCGGALGFLRTRSDGAWRFVGTDSLVHGDVRDAEIKSREDVDRHIALAKEFVAHLPVQHDCVFLTVVPWAETPRAEAATIADALGVQLLAPPLQENLHTFDGSHLDAPSAAKWSRQFFDLAGDSIRSCVAKSDEDSPAEIPSSQW